MKGDWNGQILVLTGKDADNKIVLVSLVICDVENADNYMYLLTKSKENPEFAAFLDNPATTVYTDGHKSFPPALEHCAPLAQHRLCLKHLLKNAGDIGGVRPSTEKGDGGRVLYTHHCVGSTVLRLILGSLISRSIMSC